jgi:hypothetical protein
MKKIKSKKTIIENQKEHIPSSTENSNLDEDNESGATRGIAGLFHPSQSDIMDELSRLDSYQYGKYNS